MPKRPSPSFLLPLLVLAAVPSPSAWAEEPRGPRAEVMSLPDLEALSLEEILNIQVVSATKTAGGLLEAPAAMSVLRGSDLTLYGYQSVAEALQHVLGFYVVDDHILPNVGVRGVPGGLFSQSSAIKVMIDGRSVAFLPTSGNWLGPELLPLSAVERIEIIRGPASALYGADAFLGVVNIVTRQAIEVNGAIVQGGVIPALEDRDDKRLGGDGEATVGFAYRGLELLLAARVHEEDRSGLKLPPSSPAPHLPSYAHLDDSARDLVLSSRVGYAKLELALDHEWKLSSFGHFSEIERGGAFSPWAQLTYGRDADGRRHETTIALYRAAAGLGLDFVRGDSLRFSLWARYLCGGPTEDDRIETGDSDIFYVRRKFGYRGADGAAELSYQPVERLTIVAGLEALFFEQQLPSNLRILTADTSGYAAGDVVESASQRQGVQDFRNAGAYAQALWEALPSTLNFTAGLRYDHNSIYHSQLSGRAALVYNVLPELVAKLLYGNAFKAPSPELLYALPLRPGDILGNPDLSPQRVHTVEGQLSYRFAQHFLATTGLAYSYLLNKAEFVQQGLNRMAENVARAATLSWESELRVDRQDKLGGYASFEFVAARWNRGDPATYQTRLLGSESSIYPPYQARLGAYGRLPELPLRASAEAVCVGPRRASEMNILERGAPYELDTYVRLDATVSTVGLELIGKRETRVSLFGKNLLGTTGPDPGYAGVDYPLAPRTIMLQLAQEI